MTIHSNVNDQVTVCKYTYDDNDKIISKTETDGKGSYSASTDYEYDENGNVVASHCTFDDGDTLDMSYTYEKTGTRKYDANHPPVAEKYRHFRENYNK
jgi:YD repeat-containing protein